MTYTFLPHKKYMTYIIDDQDNVVGLISAAEGHNWWLFDMEMNQLRDEAFDTREEALKYFAEWMKKPRT